MREIGETLIISKPSISTFSRKLWKSETLFILDSYLCSLEIKEVGKCKNFPKEKNIASPYRDLKRVDTYFNRFVRKWVTLAHRV